MKRGAKISAAVVAVAAVVALLAFILLREPHWFLYFSYPPSVCDFADRSARGGTVWPGPGRENMKRLPAEELAAAESYIRRHPDHTSYLLLDELRAHFPDAYARLPHDTRAAVLCDALRHHKNCNDWGILTEHPDWGDEAAALALVESGQAALPHLRPLLDDRAYFHLETFKGYSPSLDDGYRRCDFAYRYACQIMGVRPEYHPDPAARDKAVEQLKQSLDAAVPAK